MDVSNVGNVIRWPFEMLGKIINFLFSNWLVIFIIIFTLYAFYYIFSKDIIGRIVDYWNNLDKEESENLKGGIEKMFKKKVEKLPVKPEEKVEDIEIEDEEDDVVEEPTEEEPKKNQKKKVKESEYNIGDIIPVQQVVGYQVVKSIGKDGIPSVISIDKISEAEILSFIYQE